MRHNPNWYISSLRGALRPDMVALLSDIVALWELYVLIQLIMDEVP